MKKIIKSLFLGLFSFLLLLSFKTISTQELQKPIIKAGVAKLTGKITKDAPSKLKDVAAVLAISLPITGESLQLKVPVDSLGRFSMDINLQTDIAFVSLNTSVDPSKGLLIKLTNGDTTNLDISYDVNNKLKNIEIKPAMNPYDVTESIDIVEKMMDYSNPNRTSPILYNKKPTDFLNYTKIILNERLEIVKKDTLLSQELRKLLLKDYPLMLYTTHVFDYETEMESYTDSNKDKLTIQKIDRSYFSFLKDFQLNDMQYLYCSTFPEFQKAILQNEVLNLPEINDTDIPTWLTQVKTILSPLIGFDKGGYYDVLAASAYGRQLTAQEKPLSEKQKENIEKYWKDGEISKILFSENEEVAAYEKFKSPLVVNDISSVTPEKVIESILAKYKGKVVMIDLWATWCGPCLQAMTEFKSTKAQFHNKDVVFVYLTSPSSPKKLWEEKIQGMGSEHYYLTGAQWENVMYQFNFEYIPSYLLFDKEGKLKNKFSAFPGSEQLKAVINEML